MGYDHLFQKSDMEQERIVEAFYEFLSAEEFPCVVARNIVAKKTIRVMMAGELGCPRHDQAILDFIYGFCRDFRDAPQGLHSVAIIFTDGQLMEEDVFEQLMWTRLNALRKKDALYYNYDARVSDDPGSPNFSFSLMEEAFFVLALHPASSRLARRFAYPALVFNPHAQFETMKQTDTYEKLKAIVRKRDLTFSGSVNPMLTDFGNGSEALQYSGKVHGSEWTCPFQPNDTK